MKTTTRIMATYSPEAHGKSCIAAITFKRRVSPRQKKSISEALRSLHIGCSIVIIETIQ